jgi:hypothetical protein
MATTKLPPTERLILESKEDYWRLFIGGPIHMKTSALVEESPEHTIRINLIIETVIPPENMRGQNTTIFQSNLNQSACNGMARTREFMHDLFTKSMWVFIGYIDGQNKVPIIIIHYGIINMTFYSQKLTSESIQEFSSLPSLN